MRRAPLLYACIVGVVTALSWAAAQTPAPSSPAPLAKPDAVAFENYVLTLYPPADKKDGPEMAVVVPLAAYDKTRDASETQTKFVLARNSQPHLHFHGEFVPLKDGRYLLNYSLEGSNDTAGSGIVLRPGEPAQMIKSGNLYFNLRLERYNPPVAR